MIRRKAVVVCAALVVGAASSGVADAGTVHPFGLPSWQTTVYALGPNDGYVAEWTGSGSNWTVIGGPASHLYVGSAGVFATDPTTGDIAQYNLATGGWTVIGGPGQTFVQAGGRLFGLAPDGSYVAEWNGASGGWTVIDGAAEEIYGGGDQLVAIGPSGDAAYVYDGTPYAWTMIVGGGDLTEYPRFAVGDGGIYALDEDDRVDQWTGSGTNWTQIGTGFNTLYAGGEDGDLYGVNDETGAITEYSGTPNDWNVVGGYGSQFAVSRTTLYGLAPDSSYVAQFTPGVGWSEIGGPAAAIAADG
jgi:hypothetical protein